VIDLPGTDLDMMEKLAVRLVEAAAAEIRPRFRQIIPTERKADISPVTEADRAAERAMRAVLAAERPQDLLDGDTPILGVIDQPITQDRWIGIAGRPTTLNGQVVRARATTAEVSAATFSTTDPNLFPDADAGAYRRISAACGMRTYGGDGYAYGLLASGWVDVVLESGLKLHDFAALATVVEGAGGIMTDWAGAPLTAKSDGRVLAVGNAALHAQLLALI
jgi:inositol-phosphate phosphatase/L-galactose 1-phosphate phosphatase/histidinol-phosphatase